MKKFLSILLSVILIISICPMGLFSITASAASAEEITVDGIKYKIYNSAWASVVGYTSALPENVIIPSTINGYEVQSIEDNAFYNSRMESVFIPSSVYIIGECAFADCYWLKDVTISYGVEAIWNSAFSETAISEIVIPGSVEYIERYAFSDCEDLHTVILQEGVEILESDVFSGCKRLETLCIPKSFRFADDDLNYVEDYDLTIYGYKYTYAEEVALMNDCLFKEIEVSLINVSQEGLKTEYLVGTELDIKNINLYATYSFGKTYKVTDDFEVLGFDSEKLGSQTITIKYGGKHCSFNIFVYSKEEFAQSIKINKLPLKTEYIQNEDKLDCSGGEIEITYRDGSKEKMPLANRMITNFSNAVVGVKTLIVDFGNCECSFDIKVFDTRVKHIMVSINEIPTYTGNTIEIRPNVTLYGVNLTEGVDYTLSFSNNINATSDAKITITGLNDYWGYSEVISFPIHRANINTADIVVQDATYTSGNLEPEVTVNLDGIKLVQQRDFIVQYIDNFYVGTGIARIIGVGNYCGYSDVQFKIDKKVVGTVKLDSGSIKYKNGIEQDNVPMFVPAGTTISGTVSSYSGSCKIVFTSLSGETKTVYTKDLSVNINTSFYGATFTYSYTFEEAGWYAFHFNYKWRQQTGYQTAESGSVNTVYEIWCEVPPDPEMIVAGIPVEYGLRETYLHIESEDTLFAVCDPIWNSSDTTIATVNKGIVKFKKAGKVVVSATVGECTATWEIDNEALDISKNTTVFFDNEKEEYNIFWKDELLVEDTDYIINIIKKDNINIVKITGINLFSEETIALFYENSNYRYMCEHEYDNNDDLICNICELIRERPYTPGDIDGIEGVTDADAVYLLYHTFLSDIYPVNQDCDFNGDGEVNDKDAVYLLYYTFLPDLYPIN